MSSFQRRRIRKPLCSVGKSGRLSGKTLQLMLASNARTQVRPSLQRKVKDWVKRSSGCRGWGVMFGHCAENRTDRQSYVLHNLCSLFEKMDAVGCGSPCVGIACKHALHEETWRSKMPALGFEPRLPRPQRDVLTTRRCGPCFSSLNRRTAGQAFSSNSNSGIFCHLPSLPLP